MPSELSLVADVNSAKPMVNSMLQVVACDRNTAGVVTGLSRFATPDSHINRFVNPKIGMQHHRNGCLNVSYVEGWKRVAKHAMTFTARFVSPESDESSMAHFILYKQSDGRWLAAF